MITPTVETVPVKQCDFEAKVKVGGSGPPLVYLHTAGGPLWDVFVQELAKHFTVYAPDHPGTGDTDRNSIHSVEELWDLVLIYDELLDSLGLESVPVVGSSFGGMMACELAAHRPALVSKMVLIDPIGLWLDSHPVQNPILLSPVELVGALFADLEPEPVQAFLHVPEDPKEAGIQTAELIWALGTTGKFFYPIPDKGLKKRIHRITAPTQIIWGEKDALISAVYAKEFADRIVNSKIEMIEGAGHVPQWEQLDKVTGLVLDFLNGGSA